MPNACNNISLLFFIVEDKIEEDIPESTAACGGAYFIRKKNGIRRIHTDMNCRTGTAGYTIYREYLSEKSIQRIIRQEKRENMVR